MKEKIQEFLKAIPFHAFIIRMSTGIDFLIKTRDYAHLTPGGEHVAVFYGDDGNQHQYVRVNEIREVLPLNLRQ